MALKLRFVGGDILDADAEFVASRRDNPIDQQKGIAVRQKTQQPLDVVSLESLARRYVHSISLTDLRLDFCADAFLSQNSPADALSRDCLRNDALSLFRYAQLFLQRLRAFEPAEALGLAA
jgi:hypothetical protein